MVDDVIFEEISNTHGIMVDRMVKSWTKAPQFNLTIDIYLDKVFKVKEDLKKRDINVSLTDLIIFSTARALSQHPMMNSAWDGGKIKRFRHINMGMAVAVKDELVVVVIKDADQKDIDKISSETKVLIDKAQKNVLQISDISGSTCTVSNLGMFGVDNFTAILNPPEASILAVGSANKEYVHNGNGFLEKYVASFTLTVDHRVATGVTGAKFLGSIKSYLENLDEYI